MPPRDEPARGNIIPFPAAAIRRHPAAAFVTQPATPAPTPAPGRPGLAWIVSGSLVAAVAGLLLLGSLWGAAQRAARLDARHVATAHRARAAQPLATVGGVNLLIAGLDGEGCAAADRGTCSDAIVLLHLDADRGAAWLVSIPRATRVSIPGHGTDRIDAAYALGGSRLFLETMKTFTGLPIDHLAVLDRTGFRRLADALGGVDLRLASSPRRARGGGLALQMSGAMALDWVSPKLDLDDDDLDRIRRQHLVLRGLLAQAIDAHALADPQVLHALAASLGDGMRLDAGLTPPALLALAGSAGKLRLEDVTFLTAPVSPTGHGDDAVLAPDAPACAELWDAVAHDELPAFVDAHPEWVTAQTAY